MDRRIFTYPNYSKKCITFTIDDGNVKLDAKFRGYTEPAGLRGTFNLCTPLEKLPSKEDYRKFYSGYEIANHCRLHAYPFSERFPKENITDAPFDKSTADRSLIYKTDEDGLFRIYTYAWCFIADDEKYMQCVKDAETELEEIFGKGKIRGYVWPCGEQKNKAVFEALKAHGFQSLRKTGCVKDSTGFALPADRMRWSYNADYSCLTSTAAIYEALPDDGDLKFFCFGVHSHDFENNNAWDVLKDFCDRYGNRQSEFWYAGVGEIFDYEDAVNAAVFTDTEIQNPSCVNLYAVIDGKRVVIPAHGSLRV